MAMSAWARPVQGLDAGLDAVLLEARRLYGATEYEQAAAALNRAISMIDARALQDPVPRQQLVDAYELRARARFGLNDQEGARSDFRSLLEIDPTRMFAKFVDP